MAEDVEDWQLARAESHTSSGLKSAETEALEHLPDSEVKDALQRLPEEFRLAVYLAVLSVSTLLCLYCAVAHPQTRLVRRPSAGRAA